MRILDLFFKRKKADEPTGEFSPDFPLLIKKSINILGQLNPESDNEIALKLLVDKGVNEKEAIEIILFLPICFCRQLLKDINWPDSYIVISNKKQTEIKYSNTESYCLIEIETKQYFKNQPSNDIILNIVSRSSEFDAINKLLNDGGNFKDIVLTKTAILK